MEERHERNKAEQSPCQSPRKGTFLVGADADFTVVDMAKRQRVSPSMLRSAQDHSPFEGVELTGWPETTVLRGHIVYRQGEPNGKPGGRYIKRPVSMHPESLGTAS